MKTGYINYREEEEKYFEKWNAWRIEEEILYSFGKREMKHFIKAMNESYMKFNIVYKYKLIKRQIDAGYDKLSAIEKVFIDLMDYYFHGGEELGKTKAFLQRLQSFYKLNHEEHKGFKKFEKFDIQSVSILDVLGRYMKLPKNISRNVSCPLHKEKSGSFRIYKNTNSFFCFGCHKGGNAVIFVSEIENISNKEAFKKLAKIYSNNQNNG